MRVTTATPIRPDYAPQARAERLIASGRLVLALSSLTAIWFEPSTPAQYQRATYTLLSVYTVYALAVVIVAWRSAVPSARWRLVSHAGDLVLFTIFVYLTEGPASPFFLYFVFSLFCATLRFSWRGIFATGATAMAIYGAMSLIASYTDPAFEASRAMIRIAYLGVITALLVYLGLYQQHLRSELASLAAWPRELAARVDDILRVNLAHAASVMNAPRVLLIWEEPEEPWVWAALWSREACRVERVPPGTFESLPEQRNASVFVRHAGAALHDRYSIKSAIVVSLESETLGARFLVPDVRTATADELALAQIAGRLVLAALEQFFFVQQLKQTASTEERLRISRELHDGIVQSLAGVGLQLHALRSRVEGNVAEQLKHVEEVLEHDQRELRALVRELRPHDVRDGRTIVTEELRRMRERFPLEWGLEVKLEKSHDPLVVPPRLAHELCRIVNESLSNAARHGSASRAVVGVAMNEGAVHIRVADNGRGFAFAGRQDLAALERDGKGPRTLKERVRSLGGSLVIDSSASGATIDVRIPIAEEV